MMLFCVCGFLLRGYLYNAAPPPPVFGRAGVVEVAFGVVVAFGVDVAVGVCACAPIMNEPMANAAVNITTADMIFLIIIKIYLFRP